MGIMTLASLGWTENTSTGAGKQWRGIAMSSDGRKQTAVVFGGNIWTSQDYGVTWTEDTSVGSIKNWNDIAMSSDGTQQTANIFATWGNIWTSQDSGATWTEDTSVGALKLWNGIAMSSDGTQQTAIVTGFPPIGVYGGNIYTSSDNGVTWTQDTSVGATKMWYGVAMSSDGQKQTAAVLNGNIW